MIIKYLVNIAIAIYINIGIILICFISLIFYYTKIKIISICTGGK